MDGIGTTWREYPVVEVLYGAEEIASRLDEMAEELAGSWKEDTIIVGLLRGSFVFTADLIRALYHKGAHPQIDFLTISSYGDDVKSSGSVVIHRDISDSVEGKHVLIVDDILESGRTLAAAKELLTERGAKSLRIITLLEKPGKRVCEVEADLVGFLTPDVFVVGYGLDYANYYRELPFIGVLDEEDIG